MARLSVVALLGALVGCAGESRRPGPTHEASPPPTGPADASSVEDQRPASTREPSAPPPGPADAASAAGPASTREPSAPPPGPADAAAVKPQNLAKVDVILVAGGGGEVSDVEGYPAGLRKLVSAVGAEGASLDLRLALLVPRTTLDQKALAELAPALAGSGTMTGRSVMIDFGLMAKDGPLAALILGCAEAQSDFPDAHLNRPGGPRVCGQDFLALTGISSEMMTHEWLWDLLPLRGRAMASLRPDARRLYVFVATGDGEYFTPATFSTVVEAQPQLPGYRIVAVAPARDGTMGLCQRAQRAPKLAALAMAAGGHALDFCAPDWTSHAAALRAALRATAAGPR